jgi:RNA methyltransferase, TrmH family
VAVIRSRQNSKVKLARSLRELKARAAEGMFLVEGTFHIGAAFEANAPLEYILYSPKLLRGDFASKLITQLKEKNVEVLEVSPEIMDGLSDKENPAGILAVVRQQKLDLSSLTISPSSLFVAIVSPQDPGNVGSILRTIDAADAGALVLLDGGVDAYYPSAVRAAMGAHFWKPIVESKFSEFVDWAKKNSMAIYGSSAHAKLDYRKAEYKLPCALLLGSEREGLTKEQMSASDQVVGLPMRGRVTSLNLAVAAGILIYEIIGKSE